MSERAEFSISSVKKQAAKYSQHAWRKHVCRFHWVSACGAVDVSVAGWQDSDANVGISVFNLTKCPLFPGEQTCRSCSEFLLLALRSGELSPTHGGADFVLSVRSPQSTNLTRRTAGEHFLTAHVQTSKKKKKFSVHWHYLSPEVQSQIVYFVFFRLRWKLSGAVLLPLSFTKECRYYLSALQQLLYDLNTTEQSKHCVLWGSSTIPLRSFEPTNW